MRKWKTLSSKLVFDHPWFKVRQDTIQLPNGKEIDEYMLWQGKDFVYIVAMTPEGKFLMERQYKHGVGEIMTEFPAGYLNEGEEPSDAAHRELLEETGYQAEKLEYLGAFNNNPSKTTAKLHLFIARNVQKVQEQQFDETEDIEVLHFSKEEILEKIETREIWAAPTIACFFLVLQKLGKE